MNILKLLAYSLIVLPSQVQDNTPTKVREFILPLVREEALRLELIEKEEEHWGPDAKLCIWVKDIKLTRLEWWERELEDLRRRYDKALDCPPIFWQVQIPPERVLMDCMSFNRQYSRHLRDEMAITPETHYRFKLLDQAHTETDHIYHLYELARITQYSYRNIVEKRVALKELIRELGPALTFPVPVPLWAFSYR